MSEDREEREPATEEPAAERLLERPGAARPDEASPCDTPTIGFLEPGARIAGFEIRRLLGRGSFGCVYLARDLELERDVALKVAEEVGDEPQTLASLDHDHIVKVFSETIEARTRQRLLCMQYVPGTTLEGVIRKLRARPLAELRGASLLEAIEELAPDPALLDPRALRDRQLLERASYPEAVAWLGARLAEGLAYAHRRGVLHRDIKPANILLNHYGRPFLADFNIAATAAGGGERDARPALLGGTAAYMAPEHLRAMDAHDPSKPEVVSAVDERSDLYSLGVVLFRALTLELPFASDRRVTDSGHLLRSPRSALEAPLAPSCRERNASISPGLDRAIRRALDPEPAARFPDAAALAVELDGCRHAARIEARLPAEGALARAALHHPLLGFLVLAFLPHLLGSAVNIAYNSTWIVGSLSESQAAAFASLLLVYNFTVYPLCLGLAALWVAPVLHTAQAFFHDRQPIAREAIDRARQRVLGLPARAVGLALLGWLPGAVFFPLGIGRLAEAVSSEVFGHFLISFVLSALIALTYSYYCLHLLCLRGLYPRLWAHTSELETKAARELAGVASRFRHLENLPGLLPLLAVISLLGFQRETTVDQGALRVLLILLVGLGILGFLVTRRLSRRLLRSVEVLSGEAID